MKVTFLPLAFVCFTSFDAVSGLVETHISRYQSHTYASGYQAYFPTGQTSPNILAPHNYQQIVNPTSNEYSYQTSRNWALWAANSQAKQSAQLGGNGPFQATGTISGTATTSSGCYSKSDTVTVCESGEASAKASQRNSFFFREYADQEKKEGWTNTKHGFSIFLEFLIDGTDNTSGEWNDRWNLAVPLHSEANYSITTFNNDGSKTVEQLSEKTITREIIESQKVLIEGDFDYQLDLNIYQGATIDTFSGGMSGGSRSFEETFLMSAIFDEGATQENPFMPDEIADDGTYFFTDAVSGGWFDPDPWETFLFETTDGGLFTDILGFPTDFGDLFSVLYEDINGDWLSLGDFDITDTLSFDYLLGGGVDKFIVTGIESIDDQHQFPIQLAFAENGTDFSMKGIDINDYYSQNSGNSTEVPEPSSLAIFTLSLLGLMRLKKKV